MKIVFLISSISKSNPGIGGHYYSLIETVNRLAENHNVVIINIGIKEAISLKTINHRVINVVEKGPKIYKIYRGLKPIINNEKPDIIHSFDHISFLWARLNGQKSKIPYSLTKCGGVNPIYYPFVEHMVLFSEENRNHFQKKPKYKNSNLYLIPNRIQKFKSDDIRIKKIEDKIGVYKNTFKFLRITRIKEYYLESSLQLVKLINKLSDEGIKCSLIFIGTIESDECFEKLKEHSRENCFFFTTPDFTVNAKEIIDVSDAVLGTGRGFMEASSKSKMMLTPISGSYYPLLINEKNFSAAFAYNFSERISIKHFDENENYLAIKNTLTYSDLYANKLQLANELFEEFFDSKNINEKYGRMFHKMKRPIKKNRIDLLLHILFVIRAYLKEKFK